MLGIEPSNLNIVTLLVHCGKKMFYKLESVSTVLVNKV